jgi:hypothetical protein
VAITVYGVTYLVSHSFSINHVKQTDIMANSIVLNKQTIIALREKLVVGNQKKNFASRKANTKKYAIENNLLLPVGQSSHFDDNIDWCAAIKAKYDVSLEVWSDISWKSKKVITRDLKNMTDEQLKSYKNFASRKTRFNNQLKHSGVSLDKFLTKIAVTEDIFFSDQYQEDHKVTKDNKMSVYNLEYWIDTVVEIM